MIEGVLIEPLKVFADERGKVMRMLRTDAPHFTRFGEIYFSTIKPGVVKGWKKHLKMTQHFAVPAGAVRIVLFDARERSSTRGETQEFLLGEERYALLRVPPEVWYSFGSLGDAPAMMANCTDMVHDPSEVVTADIADERMPHVWG